MMKFIEKHKKNDLGCFILDKLNEIDYSQSYFSNSIGINRQTLNDIIKGKRSLSIHNAILIEKKLKLEEGFLLQIQIFNQISRFKKSK